MVGFEILMLCLNIGLISIEIYKYSPNFIKYLQPWVFHKVLTPTKGPAWLPGLGLRMIEVKIWYCDYIVSPTINVSTIGYWHYGMSGENQKIRKLWTMFYNVVPVSAWWLLSTQEYSASTAASHHAVLRQYSRIFSAAVSDDTDNDKVLLFIQISLLGRTCESRMTPGWHRQDVATGGHCPGAAVFVWMMILCVAYFTLRILWALTDASPDNPGCRAERIFFIHQSLKEDTFW